MNGWCLRRICTVIALAASLLGPAFGQGTLTTIFTNGPTSNRINVVVLSEGYQTNQLGQFLVHATNAVNNLLSVPPYQEYRSYFNAFAISVASPESGSDHPVSGVFRNTYFNSTYDPNYDRIISIPPDFANTNYNQGQGKVDALLQQLMPEYDLAILLVNDLQNGGSGGVTLISSINVGVAELVRHESGHTFAGLGDEYETPYPGYTPTERPNATQQTNRSLIKWRAWIQDSTPVPTPETNLYVNVVGLFQGAQYQSNGWYRPRLYCKMGTLSPGTDFCEVCSEQIVKSIYGRLRPIDSFSPATTNVSVASTQAVAFSVTTLQPTTHSLNVQWFTNGVAVTGATNPAYNLLPKSFSNGAHTVRAEVRDLTPLVRNDPANLLSNSIAWTLSINLSELTLISPQWLAGDRFTFGVTGTAPQGFVLQASTNLLDWTSLSTNTLAGGKYNYTNAGASGFLYRFYRTRVTP